MFRAKKQRQFRKYKNLGGASSVVRYEALKDSIIVEFKDRTSYRYTNQSATPEHVAKMKTLAVSGKGLGTLIGADPSARAQRRIR